MNDTLKVAGRIGAELGAAKAENDRLREALSRIANLPMYQCSTENDYRLSAAKAMAVGALTHQADPAETTEAYTARDMATAAAQGFRDGQAAVEPAPAQDELLPCPFCGRPAATAGKKATRFPWFKKVACSNDGCGAHFAYWHPDEWNRRASRPAQTEQQPVGHVYTMQPCFPGEPMRAHAQLHVALPAGTKLYAAPVAQTALSAVTAERDRLQEQCELNDMVHGTKGRERVAALLAKNEVLSKDAARLDWLDGYIVIAEHEDTGTFAFNSIKGALRECVDAAMAAKEA